MDSQPDKNQFWTASRIVLAVFMVLAGSMHFLYTGVYAQIVPSFIPDHREMVQISGFFEIAGGVGLLIPRVSTWAAAGLILFFIAVFPANINMALNDMAIAGRHYTFLLWLRLPLQLPLIAWAYHCARSGKGAPGNS